jgi:CRAL/TRIO domain
MLENQESTCVAASNAGPSVVTSSSLMKGQFEIKESSPLASASRVLDSPHQDFHKSSRWESFRRGKPSHMKAETRSLSASYHEKPTPITSMFSRTSSILGSKKTLLVSSTKSVGKNVPLTTKSIWKPEDIMEKIPAVVEFDTCSSNTDETAELDSSPAHRIKKRTGRGGLSDTNSTGRNTSNGANKGSVTGNSRNCKNNKNIESESCVSEPIQYYKPDVYGQVHPIETEELLNTSLAEFERQLRAVSPDMSGAALMAEEMCPDIVCRDFKICFLRAEVFRVGDAIRRYTKYWTKRIQLLGPTRAFKPITLASLTDSERYVVSSQFASILPSLTTTNLDEDGNEIGDPRCVLFIQFAYFDKATMCNEDIVRVMWYMIHSLMEDVNCQKRGFLYLQNAAKFQAIKNCPSIDFLRMCLSYVQECVPLRMSGCHVVNPNYLVKMVFPFVNLMLSERLRKRVLVHTEKTTELTAAKLSNQFKIDVSRLPVSIGGTYEQDFPKWMQQRIKDGK